MFYIDPGVAMACFFVGLLTSVQHFLNGRWFSVYALTFSVDVLLFSIDVLQFSVDVLLDLTCTI